MAWSTAELAELAGTSLRSVRHYHDRGMLLEVPERGANGWKRYGLDHLLRLKQIVRLRDLGLSLAAIGELDDGESLAMALKQLDDDLQRDVDRLQSARREIALLTEQATANPALPAGLADRLDLDQISAQDERFLVLMSCLVDRPALDEFVELLAAAYREPVLLAFDALPPDADEATRAALAEAMIDPTRRIREQHASPRELAARAAADPVRAIGLIDAAEQEMNNPAQLDVLGRVRRLREARLDVASDSREPS